jgi:hypothetical protein
MALIEKMADIFEGESIYNIDSRTFARFKEIIIFL